MGIEQLKRERHGWACAVKHINSENFVNPLPSWIRNSFNDTALKASKPGD